jgi:hypothetical protein
MIIFCFSHLKNINLMKQLNLGEEEKLFVFLLLLRISFSQDPPTRWLLGASVKMMEQGRQLNCRGRKLLAIDTEILSDCVGGILR